jgi:hypothetical protein
MLMEIAHAHRSSLGSYAPLRSLRCRAYGAERCSFFNGKAIYAPTTSGRQFKMIFTLGRNDDPVRLVDRPATAI